MFFNTDLGSHIERSERDYRALFSGANDSHLAVGEASTHYLFSKLAVPAIERKFPHSKYIVMVRNPVDMAISLHHYCVWLGIENIENFAKAWDMSGQRRLGRGAPRWCPEPRILDYERICRLGEQIGRISSLVGRERLLVVVLDDIAADPSREYGRILRFLEVPYDGRQTFPVSNRAKAVRSKSINYSVRALGLLTGKMKEVLGLRGGTGILEAIRTMNTKMSRSEPLPPDLRAQLRSAFADDVRQLEKILGRHLAEWHTP